MTALPKSMILTCPSVQLAANTHMQVTVDNDIFVFQVAMVYSARVQVCDPFHYYELTIHG